MKTMLKIKTNSHTACILARKLTAEGNPAKWMGAAEFEKVQLLKVTNEAAARETISKLTEVSIEVGESTKVTYETPEINDAPDNCTHRFLKKQKTAAVED